MPAPTVEEKVPDEPSVTKTDATDAKMKVKNDSTPKEPTTAEEKVTVAKGSTEPASNDIMVEKPKAEDESTGKTEQSEEEKKPTEEAVATPSPATNSPAQASDTPNDSGEDGSAEKGADVAKPDEDVKTETGAEKLDVETSADDSPKTAEQAPASKDDGDAPAVEKTAEEGEKKEEPLEKADTAEKPEEPIQPEGTEKVDTADKTGKSGEQDKETANDNGEYPKVRFGAVEEVAIGEDDDEYNPEEGADAESDDGEEEGEIEEGDQPMLDLQGLPQSLTASMLEKGAMNGPLHAPASKGQVDELRTLLEEGGDMEGNVDDRDIYQYTALHVAAENDKLEACKLLLEHGADIEASTKMHDSKPIHYAAFEGHDEIIGFLLEKGANINALTDDNRTPLYQAAMRGHDHCVKLLLEKGADRNLADKYGKTPADVAGKREVTDLLITPPAKKARTE